MTRQTHIEHRYVDVIPNELEEGTLYISRRFNTASHLCACGCGTRIPTPLNPSKWTLTDHGKTVSLSPSVGLGTLECRSHYWIRRSQIDWFPDMTDAQTRRAQARDHYASQVFTGEVVPPPPQPQPARPNEPKGWWQSFLNWLRKLIG